MPSSKIAEEHSSSPMTTQFPAFDNSPSHNPPSSHRPTDPPPMPERPSSDEDGTLQGEAEDPNVLRVVPSYLDGSDSLDIMRTRSPMSAAREQAKRTEDDIEMLRAEKVVSHQMEAQSEGGLGRSKSMVQRSRSRTAAQEPDVFDSGTTPLHEITKIYQPPPHPATRLARLIKRVHQSSYLVRYFVYITPLTLILLIPLLLGLLVFKQATVGDVRLFWFSIWLMIIWLSLWAGRIIAKSIPYPMGLLASIFTNNSKKWRDLGKSLEIPATLFFWWLAIEISFLPTMINHHLDGNRHTRHWEITTNKVIVSMLVGVVLNFIAKIIIQLIAISFHLRTYSDRIEVNKFQIASLVKLYQHSKEKIAADDSEFEDKDEASGPGSGARTPMVYINKAGKGARQALNKVGDVAGKVAGDFTGKAVTQSNHPHQVILQLLSTNSRSQVLARRLWRTYRQQDEDNVSADDLKDAFDNEDEADAAFQMFDKDMNGDISMQELEAVCVEIGRERKAITASLKDLDSVVGKLDDFFLFVVFVITVLVFISLISTSAAGVLTSAGSAVLALSWLFAATAQEFLQSVIFVFVKHPFDVGDRVTIYGNTGTLLKGDDYFVKEISLLYTEFKKMEGHVVQAPNSYLNTLFVLNQRRSGGLAEAVPVVIKFGTSLEQIERLREGLTDFVSAENREYQSKILTELTTITEAYSITLNVVFFYKSNWQNELLRLQRRNKFICALMVIMQELDIEGPRRLLPGNVNYPLHLNGAFPPSPAPPYSDHPQSPGPGPRSGSLVRDQLPYVSPTTTTGPNDAPPPQTGPQPQSSVRSQTSILRNRNDSSSRRRGESLSSMGRRVDFSLGMTSISPGDDDFGDVFEDKRQRLPTIMSTSPSPASSRKPSIAGRTSEEDSELHMARTTSRDSSNLGRINSTASARGVHRNRFFSRARSKLSEVENESTPQDLETGLGVVGREISVHDMPDIPEALGSIAASPETRSARNVPVEGQDGIALGKVRRDTDTGKIDPRTGIVSGQAVMDDSARAEGHLPAVGMTKRAQTGL